MSIKLESLLTTDTSELVFFGLVESIQGANSGTQNFGHKNWSSSGGRQRLDPKPPDDTQLIPPSLWVNETTHENTQHSRDTDNKLSNTVPFT